MARLLRLVAIQRASDEGREQEEAVSGGLNEDEEWECGNARPVFPPLCVFFPVQNDREKSYAMDSPTTCDISPVHDMKNRLGKRGLNLTCPKWERYGRSAMVG